MKQATVMHLHADNKIYGAERNILSLLKYLSRENSRIYLVCLCLNKDNSEFINAAKGLSGVEVISIYMKHKYDISALIELRELLRKLNIKILHTHGYKTDIMAFIVSRFLPVKLVSTLHGWVSIDTKLKFNNFLSRQVLKHFDKVIVLSKALQDETIQYISGGKIAYIRNAVDTEYLDKVEPLDLDKAIGIAKDLIVVAYVGRLSEEKGVDYLIKAASLVSKKNDHVVFLFIGDGPMRVELQKTVDELGLRQKAYFIGYRKDVLSILKSSGLFVLPSLTEGISRSCMEAMGLGMLVLATNVGGMPELIEDGKNGFLVSPKRADLLAEKIDLILKNKDKFDSLRVKAVETIQEKFSMNNAAREHEQLYSALMA